MRKKFLFFVLVPLGVCLVLIYVFVDSWVESGLEYLGERAVGARVEIDGLHLGISPLGIEFERLQVANKRDPWKNLFETGRVKFAMDFNQLLRGKYIIETVEVADLIMGTKRTTDGSLPSPPQPGPSVGQPSLTSKIEEAVDKKVSDAPMLDIQKLRRGLNIDSLLNVHNLQTLRHIDSLKSLVQGAGAQWEAAARDVEQSKQQLIQLEASLRSIDPKELKTIDQLTSAATTIKNASGTITGITTTLNTRRTAIESDVARLGGAVNSIDDALNRDYRSLSRLARLPDVSMMGVAELLFGKKLYDDVVEYLSWAELIKQHVPSSSGVPEKESPPRLEGQTIRFPADGTYPKFWIKTLAISGGTDSTQDADFFYVRGKVENISSDQRLTGFPLTAALTATKAGKTTVALSASFDRLTDLSHDTYRARVSGLEIEEFPVGRSDFLPSHISRAGAVASIGAEFTGSDFEGTAGLRVSNVSIEFERPARTVVERLTEQVLRSVKQFQLNLRLWEKDQALRIALQTDLDDQLANETRRVIGEEVDRIQRELKAKLDQKIAAKRQEFQRIYQQKRAEGLARAKELQEISSRSLALVDTKQKEISARIDEETKKQSDAAKKMLQDAAKGLLKKKQ